MILFLDFDGVLHPRSTLENLFVHIPRLESVLRDFPFVQVVISSSWREVTPLLEIQGKFSEDLRHRIIGTTPLVDIDYPPGPVGHREEEIRIFMEQPEFIGKPWLALDDEAPFFTAGCPNLILCNALTGLDDQVERQLRDRIMRMLDDETLELMRAARPRYTAKELNAHCDLRAPMPDDLLEWEQIPAVGREAL